MKEIVDFSCPTHWIVSLCSLSSPTNFVPRTVQPNLRISIARDFLPDSGVSTLPNQRQTQEMISSESINLATYAEPTVGCSAIKWKSANGLS